MRLIDADALEARLKFVIEKGTASAFGLHPLYAEAVLADINSMQTEPHWIPVTERTPQERDHKDDMVLVCYDNGLIRFDTCINGEWIWGNPIAWMPLPEPYKGVMKCD